MIIVVSIFTTPVFNKLSAEKFAARLALANITSKNDTAFAKNRNFDDKQKKINKKLLLIKQNM